MNRPLYFSTNNNVSYSALRASQDKVSEVYHHQLSRTVLYTINKMTPKKEISVRKLKQQLKLNYSVLAKIIGELQTKGLIRISILNGSVSSPNQTPTAEQILLSLTEKGNIVVGEFSYTNDEIEMFAHV